MPLPLIAVFRGGYSGESVISHQSADRMMNAIDRQRFDPVFITVTREHWSCESPNGITLSLERGALTVDRGHGAERISAALIAIHGAPGEDGKLQGLLDMLGIPYQTGSVLAMALTFSKYATTGLLRQLGFMVAPSVLLTSPDAVAPEEIVAKLGLPCFVKPDQSGSSLGISKVKTKEELPAALEKAFAEDDAVMVEGAVSGRELTCGVLRLNGGTRALPVCEIKHSREFFDYEAKYHATDTQELVPAPIPDEVAWECQRRSVAIYDALRCRGMVRVDHMWDGHAIWTIEVNTTPGFSAASIFPKMILADGGTIEGVVNGLIAETLQRAPR